MALVWFSKVLTAEGNDGPFPSQPLGRCPGDHCWCESQLDFRLPPPQIPHYNCVGGFAKGTRWPTCLWESCGFPTRKRHLLSQHWTYLGTYRQVGQGPESYREASPGKVSLSKTESPMTSPLKAAGTLQALTYPCFLGDTGFLSSSLVFFFSIIETDFLHIIWLWFPLLQLHPIQSALCLLENRYLRNNSKIKWKQTGIGKRQREEMVQRKKAQKT